MRLSTPSSPHIFKAPHLKRRDFWASCQVLFLCEEAHKSRWKIVVQAGVITLWKLLSHGRQAPLETSPTSLPLGTSHSRREFLLMYLAPSLFPFLGFAPGKASWIYFLLWCLSIRQGCLNNSSWDRTMCWQVFVEPFGVSHFLNIIHSVLPRESTPQTLTVGPSSMPGGSWLALHEGSSSVVVPIFTASPTTLCPAVSRGCCFSKQNTGHTDKSDV